jgi:hypothetical protein
MVNLCSLEDSSVEDIVAKSCRDILTEAASNSLKAVELANTLRARVGTEVLAHIRERWGGLLSLLERHPRVFRVDRIPKNDLVSLVGAGPPPPPPHSHSHSHSQAGSFDPFGMEVGGHRSRMGSPAIVIGGGGGMPHAHSQPQLQSQLGHVMHRQSDPSFANMSSTTLDRQTPTPPPLPYALQQSRGAGMGMGMGYSLSATSPGPGAGAGAGAGSVMSSEGMVSRCLHVGNVPANMTETQLLRELERYGEVDCLKLGR